MAQAITWEADRKRAVSQWVHLLNVGWIVGGQNHSAQAGLLNPGLLDALPERPFYVNTARIQ